MQEMTSIWARGARFEAGVDVDLRSRVSASVKPAIYSQPRSLAPNTANKLLQAVK